jgi:peptidoglycan hydrolase CwlO-like protein
MVTKMIKKSVTLLITFLLLSPTGAFGQSSSSSSAPQDSVCVPVKQLERVRDDIQKKEKKIEDLQRLKRNLESQVQTLRALRQKDSLLIGIKDRRIKNRNELLEEKNKEIRGLREQVESANLRKWLYFVGGAAAVIGSAYVVGQTN